MRLRLLGLDSLSLFVVLLLNMPYGVDSGTGLDSYIGCFWLDLVNWEDWNGSTG